MDLREESWSLDLESEGGELRSRVLYLRDKVPSRPLGLSKEVESRFLNLRDKVPPGPIGLNKEGLKSRLLDLTDEVPPGPLGLNKEVWV